MQELSLSSLRILFKRVSLLALFCCLFALPVYAMQPIPRTAKDTTPPTGSISIPGSFQSQRLELRLSAQDNVNGTGVSKMQFSDNGTSWSLPELYNRDKVWTAAKDFGFANIYVRFMDKAGNWSKAYSTTTFISNPSKVKGITNYDPDINDDGKVNAIDVQLVINAALGINIGSFTADVNHDGKVDAMDVQLVINAALGIDINQPPKITTINPVDGALFYEGDSVAISVTGYLVGVQYQFSLDGVIKQPWSSISTYSWVSNSQQSGKRRIKVEAKNNFGSTYKEAEVYILKKPISPP